MTRLPKYAERFFAAQVSEFDAFCHRVDEDENGWDYIVELPNSPHTGPADEQPAHDRAYVQIKSTTGSDTTVQITLSNLRKASQDPQPWFVALIRVRTHNQ